MFCHARGDSVFDPLIAGVPDFRIYGSGEWPQRLNSPFERAVQALIRLRAQPEDESIIESARSGHSKAISEQFLNHSAGKRQPTIQFELMSLGSPGLLVIVVC